MRHSLGVVENVNLFVKQKPPHPGAILLSLVFLTFASHFAILLTSGYFSHDEWQRLEELYRLGWKEYLYTYGRVRSGPTFGFPVRPIGFVQQGLSALWLQRSPFLVHAIDVLIHALVVALVWLGARAWHAPRRHAVAIAVIFALSPLTTIATGWVGASFDRWYVLFVLAASVFAAKQLDSGKGFNLLAVFVAATGAILSKESALMLPAWLVLLFGYRINSGHSTCSVRRMLEVLIAATLPIAIYLTIRAPAIMATLHKVDGPYSPSSANIAKNIIAYAAYPFIPNLIEIVSIVLIPKWEVGLALLTHLGLIYLLTKRFGWHASLLYIFAYFTFLAPILTLASTGAHYLYAAAIPLAVALAALWFERGGWQRACVGLAISIMLTHAFFIQRQIYRVGECQATFLHSLNIKLRDVPEGGTLLVDFHGQLGYVGKRSIFGRSSYDGSTTGRTVVVERGLNADNAVTSAIMTPQCVVK